MAVDGLVDETIVVRLNLCSLAPRRSEHPRRAGCRWFFLPIAGLADVPSALPGVRGV